jgi:preprotein translocase subunit SecA
LAIGLARRSQTDNGEIGALQARRLIDRAQRRAEKTAFDIRRRLLHADHWLDEQLGFAGRTF